MYMLGCGLVYKIFLQHFTVIVCVDKVGYCSLQPASKSNWNLIVE